MDESREQYAAQHQALTSRHLIDRSRFFTVCLRSIVFPILSALSRFVKQDRLRHWRVVYPKVFADEDMLIAARRQLSSCGGRPMLTGRPASAYEGLMTLTEMAVRYSEKAGAA